MKAAMRSLGKPISRRRLLHALARLSFLFPLVRSNALAGPGPRESRRRYRLTIDTLRQAHRAETVASRHYQAYRGQALSDNYPNIAYLFHAFSISEKTHADNYRRLLVSFGATPEKFDPPLRFSGTRENLRAAAVKELQKINEFYPDIVEKLSSESHAPAILNCIYSWKSHRQHEKIIHDIKKYSSIFFGPLSRRIEKMRPNFFVCRICGSTIDEPPSAPCEICRYPMSHYQRLKRPALPAG